MKLGRCLRHLTQQQASLSTIIDVLDLVGSLLFLIAAILAFLVPAPAPPVTPVSEPRVVGGISENARSAGGSTSDS